MVSKLVPKELHFGNPFSSIIPYNRFISVSLCLGDSMLKISFLVSLRHCAFALNRITFPFAFSAPRSPATAATAQLRRRAHTREPVAALSGISRAITVHFVSIQRILPCCPPVISAENMHNHRHKNVDPYLIRSTERQFAHQYIAIVLAHNCKAECFNFVMNVYLDLNCLRQIKRDRRLVDRLPIG